MSKLNPKLQIFGEDEGSVIFSCPGQIWSLKIFSEGWGSRSNLKFKNFSEGWRVGHLTMSRPNLKFILFGEVGGQSSFHVQNKAEISIFQQRLDGWSSYHTQAKSDIWNISMGEGSVTFPCPGQIWNLKFLVGVDHLSMSRPNLWFKLFGEVWVSHLSHVQA